MRSVTSISLSAWLMDVCLAVNFSGVTGNVGSNISITCRYPEEYKNNSKYFCRMDSLFSLKDSDKCVLTTQPDTWSERGRLALLDSTTTHVLTALVSRLLMEDSGMYCCGVDISQWPDFTSKIQLTVKGNAQTPTTQPGITQPTHEWNWDSYSRFMTMIALVCVCALFFVCVFGLFQVLKQNNHNLSGTPLSHTRKISDTVQENHQKIECSVLSNPPMARSDEGSDAEEFDRTTNPNDRNTEPAKMIPDSDADYIDVESVLTHSLDLDKIYSEVNTNRQSHVYQCLRADSVEESVYHSIDRSAECPQNLQQQSIKTQISL